LLHATGVISLQHGSSTLCSRREKGDEEEFMLEEITVTAEKREAELQKVPIDITVLRPEEMDRSGVYSIYDLKKVIPDIDTATQTGNQVMISIRGVGGAADTLWNPIHETTTAVHIDGIQLTKANGFDNMSSISRGLRCLKAPGYPLWQGINSRKHEHADPEAYYWRIWRQLHL
jgi:iron complex outermembrane receptor protein